ncbi:serine hydrolase domain-containing protein, partial [Bacteroidota bacterium]
PYGDPRNDVTRLFQSSDPIRFVLSKTMHAPPGVQFHYNSGVTNVLAEIIRLQTNQSFLQYADANLFQPLGITNYQWERIHGNYYFASGGLHLRPRDLTKIGYVFLNNGMWNGQQLITQDWINASTTSYIDPGSGWFFANGYGYQWWINTSSSNSFFLAAGYGEQYMLVCPQLELILLFNGSYFGTPVTVHPFELIENYIKRSLGITDGKM